MKRLSLSLSLSLLLFLLIPLWCGAASKLDIDRTTPYLTATTMATDGTYLYGWENQHIVRYNSSWAKTTGYDTGADGVIRGVYASKREPGKVFWVKSDASALHSLWMSTDYGVTATKVLDLGVDETFGHFADCWLLGHGVIEVVIGGVNYYMLAEYNANTSGDRVEGGKYDKVRIMKSTDGTTWTEVVHFNVGSRTMRHFHCIVQDPYTLDIYIGFGDDTDEQGIIRWTPTTGEWTDNAALSTFDSKTGFTILRGAGPGDQIYGYKPLTFMVTANHLLWTADAATESGVDTGGGVWRAGKDLSSPSRVHSLDDYENHFGWTSLVTTGGKLIYTSQLTASSTDRQIKVVESDDGGTTWEIIGVIGTVAAATEWVEVCEYNNRIIFSGTVGGTTGSPNGAYITAWDGGVYAEEFPVIFHPVFWISTTGSDDNDGHTPTTPFKTLAKPMLDGNYMSGTRYIVAAGSYAEDHFAPVFDAGGAGTGQVVIEGATSNPLDTQIYLKSTDGTGYLLSVNQNNQNFLLKNLTAYSRAAASKVIALSFGVTGSKVYSRNARIGNTAYSIAGCVNHPYFDFKRTWIEGDASTWLIGSYGNNGTVRGESSILKGGNYQYIVDGSTGTTHTFYNVDFIDFAAYGVYLGDTNNTTPTIKNSVFKAGTGATADISNGSFGATFNDAALDYNAYTVGGTLTNVQNSGGTHRVTTDPLFRSTTDFRLKAGSPAINAGMNSVSGSVTLANSRLSLVNGTAFVDFSAAGTLTPYLGGKLTVTDSAGKKAVGYLKSAGTGETLDTETVVNGGFEGVYTGGLAPDWTSSRGTPSEYSAAPQAGSASQQINNPAGNNGFVGPSSLPNGTAGALYKHSVYYKVLSGTAEIRLEDGINHVISKIGLSSATWANVTTYMTLPATRTKVFAYLYAASNASANTNSVVFDSNSMTKVLTPSITGATITSTRGGTTYNWESVEAGFNFNDAAEYTYTISDFLPTTDFAGRTIRGLPDIGAYEFYGSGGQLGMGMIYGF